MTRRIIVPIHEDENDVILARKDFEYLLDCLEDATDRADILQHRMGDVAALITKAIERLGLGPGDKDQ